MVDYSEQYLRFITPGAYCRNCARRGALYYYNVILFDKIEFIIFDRLNNMAGNIVNWPFFI